MISSTTYEARPKQTDNLFNPAESEGGSDEFSSILNALFVELPANFPSVSDDSGKKVPDGSNISAAEWNSPENRDFFGYSVETEVSEPDDLKQTEITDLPITPENPVISESEIKNRVTGNQPFSETFSIKKADQSNFTFPNKITETKAIPPDLTNPGEVSEKNQVTKPVFESKEINPENNPVSQPKKINPEILPPDLQRPETKNNLTPETKVLLNQTPANSPPAPNLNHSEFAQNPKNGSSPENVLTKTDAADNSLPGAKQANGKTQDSDFYDFEVVRLSKPNIEKTETGKGEINKSNHFTSAQTPPNSNLNSLPKLFQEVTDLVQEKIPATSNNPQELSSNSLNEEVIIEAETKISSDIKTRNKLIFEPAGEKPVGNVKPIPLPDKKGRNGTIRPFENPDSSIKLEAAIPSTNKNKEIIIERFENKYAPRIDGIKTENKTISDIGNRISESEPEKINNDFAETETDPELTENTFESTDVSEVVDSTEVDIETPAGKFEKSRVEIRPDVYKSENSVNLKSEITQPANSELKEINRTISNTNLDAPEVFEQVKSSLRDYLGNEDIPEEKPQILKLRLRPAELGEVEIHLEKNSLGKLTVRFEAENETTQKILTESFEVLQDSLQDSGWQVEDLDISNDSKNSPNQSGGFEYREEYSSRERTIETNSPEKNDFDDSEQIDGLVDKDQSNRLVNLRA